ncbi:hypothetical protein HPB47_007502 [Ixodes persulcatus]|uniref:Uncharacterized protein n=1 Tax=Ixodes persulcatus TaxID=34615 RepID=A0AC60P7F2_IXOPE|nr:hypothetical protein HPB47_007502 [Ixodes persulcatus]
MSYPPGQQGYASGGHGYPAQGQVYSSGGMSYPLGSQGYPTPGRMGVAQGYTQPTAQGIYTSAVGTGVPAAGNPGYPSAPSPQYVTSQNQQGYTNWADLVNAADADQDHLLHSINLTWTGQLPLCDLWKNAHMIFIPKPGKPVELSNLRPITLTSHVVPEEDMDIVADKEHFLREDSDTLLRAELLAPRHLQDSGGSKARDTEVKGRFLERTANPARHARVLAQGLAVPEAYGVARNLEYPVILDTRAAATARAREVVRTWPDSSGSRNICSQRKEEEEEETLLVFRDQVLGVVEAQRAAATARAREVVRTWVDSSGSRNICSQRNSGILRLLLNLEVATDFL